MSSLPGCIAASGGAAWRLICVHCRSASQQVVEVDLSSLLRCIAAQVDLSQDGKHLDPEYLPTLAQPPSSPTQASLSFACALLTSQQANIAQLRLHLVALTPSQDTFEPVVLMHVVHKQRSPFRYKPCNAEVKDGSANNPHDTNTAGPGAPKSAQEPLVNATRGSSPDEPSSCSSWLAFRLCCDAPGQVLSPQHFVMVDMLEVGWIGNVGKVGWTGNVGGGWRNSVSNSISIPCIPILQRLFSLKIPIEQGQCEHRGLALSELLNHTAIAQYVTSVIP